jgi:hypothetical protein
MVAETIELRFGVGARVAHLRELTGRDEQAVSGTSTADAIRLLDALLSSPVRHDAERLCAVDLAAADRDRMLATVYERAFGDRIESTLTCTRCTQPVDLHFSLRQLTASLNDPCVVEGLRPLGNARFEAVGGARFRVPTGRDELDAADFEQNEAESLLLNRCAEGGAWPGGAGAFQEMLDEVAPLIDLELTASCAECGYPHTIQFDIQSYLLGALLGERNRLIKEIHRVATAYGWCLDDILSLTRSERRQLVELIENEISRHGRLTR